MFFWWAREDLNSHGIAPIPSLAGRVMSSWWAWRDLNSHGIAPTRS